MGRNIQLNPEKTSLPCYLYPILHKSAERFLNFHPHLTSTMRTTGLCLATRELILSLSVKLLSGGGPDGGAEQVTPLSLFSHHFAPSAVIKFYDPRHITLGRHSWPLDNTKCVCRLRGIRLLQLSSSRLNSGRDTARITFSDFAGASNIIRLP